MARETMMPGEMPADTPHEAKPKRQARRRSDVRDAEPDHARSRDAQALALRRVAIGGEPGLTLAAVVAVARGGVPVALAPAALERVRAARAFVERICAEDRVVYGVTTGFGKLSSVKIAPEQLAALQRNLIRSHSSGVGEPFDVPTTRAVLLLLLNSLARGHSGVRAALLELLVGLLNARVTPVVPTRGSVGASGDLAPLAHLSLVLAGEGEAWYQDERLAGV